MLPGEKNSDSQSHSYPILQKEERKKKKNKPLFLIFSSHFLEATWEAMDRNKSRKLPFFFS